MFCLKCGEKMDEGSEFCQRCGAAADIKPAPNPLRVLPPGPGEIITTLDDGVERMKHFTCVEFAVIAFYVGIGMFFLACIIFFIIWGVFP